MSAISYFDDPVLEILPGVSYMRLLTTPYDNGEPYYNKQCIDDPVTSAGCYCNVHWSDMAPHQWARFRGENY